MIPLNESSESARDPEVKRLREVYAQREANGKEHYAVNPGTHRPVDLRRWEAYTQALARCGSLPLGQVDVLDVGCQTGTWLALCRKKWGQGTGRLAGIELMENWVQTGRQRHPYLELHAGSAHELPWPDATFDYVHQGMVFSSILDADLRDGIAAEMARVLKPGGHVIWYDFFLNPKNLDTVGMTLRRVQALFPRWPMAYRKRVTLAPPLARRLERRAPWLIAWLTKIRVLNFHYLVLMQKPE